MSKKLTIGVPDINMKNLAPKLLVLGLIVAAFVIGMLWQKVQLLEKGGTATTTTPAGQAGIKNDKNQSGKLADFLKPAIDAGFMKSCLDSGKYDQRLGADMAIGGSLFTAAGMNAGTPGFFVNNVAYGGAYSWDNNLTNPTTKTEIQNSNMKAITDAALQGNAVTAKLVAGTKIDITQIKSLWSKDVIKIGDGNSKVLFVEVGDPSCPYCHAAGGLDAEISKQVGLPLATAGGTYIAPVTEMKKMTDNNQASFAYVYYPGHGNGEMGMKAMYCATEKGKFWEVHDLLMSHAGYILMNGN